MNLLRPFLSKSTFSATDLLHLSAANGNQLSAGFRELVHGGHTLVGPAGQLPALAWLCAVRSSIAKHSAALVSAEREIGELDRSAREVLAEEWLTNDLVVAHLVSPEDTPLLERLRLAERVHPTDRFDAFRSRAVAPRRMFTLEHPSLCGWQMPAAFACTALVEDRENDCGSIPHLLDLEPCEDLKESAKVAVFYSISAIEPGLQSVRVGKKLLEMLLGRFLHEKEIYPALESFTTLSPIPSFLSHLRQQPHIELQPLLSLLEHHHADNAEELAEEAVSLLARDASRYRDRLRRHVAKYITEGGDDGQCDPVASFHLSNGASLGGVHFLADPSPRRVHESLGMMVNYQYDPAQMARRALHFREHQIVDVEPRVIELTR